MLTSLPSDIVLLVLREYVGVALRDLSAMDVAFCCAAVRSDLLACLARSRIHDAKSPLQLMPYLHWITARGVKQSMLDVRLHALRGAGSADLPVLPHVQKIYFIDESHIKGPPLGSFSFIRSSFPSLRTVNCSRWSSMSDQQLRSFRSYPLISLNLSNCYNLSAAEVIITVCSMAGSLQQLNCDVLDDEALNILSAHWQTAKCLRMECNRVEHASAIESFCIQNPDLDTLELFYHFVPPSARIVVTDGLIRNITRSCSKLTSINLGIGSENSTASFHDILANCPLILRIRMCGAYFEFMIKDSRRICHVCCMADASESFITAACSDRRVSIYKFVVLPVAKFAVKGPLLRALADSSGLQIEHFQGILDCSFSDDIQHFFEHCPNLHTLILERVADAAAVYLAALPILCQNMTTLHLPFCSMSSEILIDALDNYKLSKITNLSFRWRREFCDTVMVKVAEVFQSLTLLDLTGTAVTNEKLLELIVEGKLRASTIQCSNAALMRDQLSRLGCCHKPVFVDLKLSFKL